MKVLKCMVLLNFNISEDYGGHKGCYSKFIEIKGSATIKIFIYSLIISYIS